MIVPTATSLTPDREVLSVNDSMTMSDPVPE